MLALGRLLRLSLAPSAAADVAAGVILGAAGSWPPGEMPGAQPFVLIASSLAIYHGAMAVNDWADRAADAHTRPDRPIPSGSIPAPVALALGLGLTACGVFLAFRVGPGPGLWMSAVASAALLYDVAGRGPVQGPFLLGLCRFGNLGVGLVFAGSSEALGGAALTRLAPALLYGAYVFFVSRLGRLEDGEGGTDLGARPARLLTASAVCLALVPLIAWLLPGQVNGRAWLGALAALCVAWPAAKGLVRAARQTEPWTPADVGRCMGLALRRLLPFTAAVALLALPGGSAPLWVAAAILSGFPLSYALRRVFPPS